MCTGTSFFANSQLDKRYIYLRSCISPGETFQSQSAKLDKIMATAFVIGDKFRNNASKLLEKTESSLPQQLREELEETLQKTGPTTMSFSTARKLQKYLQGNSKVLNTA